MYWTWDEDKNRANQLKHHISFETAQLVFGDPFNLVTEDPYPYEQRWRVVGSVRPDILTVIYTRPGPDPETGEEVGRIITARKATRHE